MNIKKVAYSCVVDNNPKYYSQCYIWVNCLIINLSVDPKDIYVHFVEGCDEQVVEEIKLHGVNAIYVKRRSLQSPPLNKLRQLETPALLSYDYIVLSDCDKIYYDYMLSWLDGDNVKACSFVARPNYDTFCNIYDLYELSKPVFCYRAKGGKNELDPRTPPNNVNGGTYIIPVVKFAPIAKEWIKATEWLERRLELLGPWKRNLDQVSFCMALDKLQDNVVELPKYFDLGMNVKNYPADNKDVFAIGALHYHDSLSKHGIVCGNECLVEIKEHVVVVNNLVKLLIKKYPAFKYSIEQL